MPSQGAIAKILREPPFRILTKALYAFLPVSVETRALWDISLRPNYLNGLLLAARQAQSEGIDEIAAVEFGVAGGNGLLVLQSEAEAIEKETGVRIKVIGFDNGPGGLPTLIGDHRDHPDAWQPGDYPMDYEKLRAKLTSRTRLILGNVRDTVPTFVSDRSAPPIGFISLDLDLYSSTVQALEILTLPGARILRRTFLYLDDVELIICHRFAGELLAIDEFNRAGHTVKIDRLRGFADERPFSEKRYLRMMYVAHDLVAISRATPEAGRRPLMSHSLR
jgi:hypothetical protein